MVQVMRLRLDGICQINKMLYLKRKIFGLDMKRIINLSMLISVIVSGTCRKGDVLDKYSGNFIIQLPKLYQTTSYFSTSPDTTLFWLDKSNAQVWNFERADAENFIISVAGKPEMVLYVNDLGGIFLSPRPSGRDNHIYFTILPRENDMISILSTSFGKYLVFGICEKNGEVLSYWDQVGELNTCRTQSGIGSPDICYCASKFILEKK